MHERKVNMLIVLFSIIGAVAGAVAGEIVLNSWESRMPGFLLAGLYFGLLALAVGVMFLLAEIISPWLNGRGWRLRYAADGWKLLLPATLLLLFVGGAVLQLAYGLSFGRVQPPDNIVLVIDVSGSMEQTDPSRESFRAARELVNRMENGKRVAVIAFNHRVTVIQPLTLLDGAGVRQELADKLDSYGQPDGQTNIEAALSTAIQHIQSKAAGGPSMVILISDGYSNVDLARALAPYRQQSIAVNTVGVSPDDLEGNALLRDLAYQTGGAYHSVDNVTQLSAVFTKIYRMNQGWHLLGERTGAALESGWYTALRVICLAVIGGLMGLGLGMIFDNRYLARSFAVGGVGAGVLAGLILELGLKHGLLPAWGYRALAAVVLALVLSLSTGIIPYKRNREEGRDTPYQRHRGGGDPGLGGSAASSRNRFQ